MSDRRVSTPRHHEHKLHGRDHCAGARGEHKMVIDNAYPAAPHRKRLVELTTVRECSENDIKAKSGSW
ncbi:hypothetical protein SUGI_1018050 [Cryptomeria japonica]|nr:hypothetical protein SUGI_1018050 [Cryptomeria japonica]